MLSQDSAPDLARVLTDLRQKRARLDEAIRAIEDLLGNSNVDSASDSPQSARFELLDALDQQHSSGYSNAPMRQGPFDGLSILTATREVLAQAREPRTAIEIASLLVSGGYQAKSRNFANTVAAVLNRCDKTGGDIIRVGKNLFTLVERNQAFTSNLRSTPNE
jgi:hypothetical protein